MPVHPAISQPLKAPVFRFGALRQQDCLSPREIRRRSSSRASRHTRSSRTMPLASESFAVRPTDHWRRRFPKRASSPCAGGGSLLDSAPTGRSHSLTCPPDAGSEARALSRSVGACSPLRVRRDANPPESRTMARYRVALSPAGSVARRLRAPQSARSDAVGVGRSVGPRPTPLDSCPVGRGVKHGL